MNMKNIVLIAILVGLLTQTGCVSYYNHKRVLNNEAEAFIMASGDQAAITALRTGVAPVKVIQTRILTSPNGNPDGVGILFAPFELKTYVKSFKENKVSYSLSLIADAALAVTTAMIIDKNMGGSGGSSSGATASASAHPGIGITGNGNSVSVQIVQTTVGGNTDSSNRSDNRDQSSTPVVIR